MASPRRRLRGTVVGFLGAMVVLAALAWVVGVGDLVEALSGASLGLVGGVVLAALVWVIAWALALRTVLAALDARLTVPRALAVYAGVLFANNVTPFGQAGGEPVSALLIAESAQTEYETALAAIASADSLNVVPSTLLALVGVGYVSVVATTGGVVWATAMVVALAVTLPVVAWLAWRYRSGLESGTATVLTPLTAIVGSRIPRLTAPSTADVERRVGGFFRSIEVVAGDRRRLVLAIGLSTVGWLAQVMALWLALYAVGEAVPIAAVLVAVPVAAIAGVTPLPGGLGGIEAVLVALLVPLAGVAAPVSAAAVVIHRGAIYWLPTVVGGGVVSVVGARRV